MSLIYRLLASSTGSRTSAIWAFVLCGFAVTAVPAQAADMGIPARSYYPPPPPPAIYDWTGIYVGGHIGGGLLVDSVSQNGVSAGGSILRAPAICAQPASSAALRSAPITNSRPGLSG